MNSIPRIVSVVLLSAMMVAPALADWDPWVPYKWVQDPDLTANGIDVNATLSSQYVLADDFECRSPNPITGIHIWGAWRGDALPPGGAADVIFVLSIHADIPADQSPTGYSMPGAVLWQHTFQPGEFTVRDGLSADVGWLDPPDVYSPTVETYRQYNFHLEPPEAFEQQGTPAAPVVYWLSVQANAADPDTFWGWRTAAIHWNDNAVWGVGTAPITGPWDELTYPTGHPLGPGPIDLAFVITDEEYCNLDCPPGATAEGEPDCGWPIDTVNGGCDAITAVFSSISCGETVCGTAQCDGSMRDDTDWYAITITTPTEFMWQVEAEFDVLIGLADIYPYGLGDCAAWMAGDFEPSAAGALCEPVQITTGCLPPGTYYFYVAPDPNGQVFSCGREYYATLSCVDCVLETGACCNDGPPSVCVDGEPWYNCLPPYRFAPNETCVTMYPPCGADFGACCDGSGGCTLMTAPDCAAGNGHYLGNGTSCVSNDCVPNDDCDFAMPVGNVTDLPFDTTNASFDGSGTCMSGPNIWYCYTATCNGEVTVSLCGSSYDTRLAVYEGCVCNPLGLEIGCEDDTCGLQSEIRFPATAGSAYLIEVGGWGPAAGPGVLSIHCAPETWPKWSQLPHGPDEGFDAPSGLWWNPHLPKWEQVPDTSKEGKFDYDANPTPVIYANDWVCPGGVVTDLHWWGVMEVPQEFLWGFHLSIHTDLYPPTCLPYQVSAWEADIPMVWINSYDTGDDNIDGLSIFKYEYNLPPDDWFAQTPGERYWFDVQAISRLPVTEPAAWQWQQAIDDPPSCRAAQRAQAGGAGDWNYTPDPGIEFAFAITSAHYLQPRKIVTDDFVSDGRPIHSVRWWGSYLDPEYEPEYPPTFPHVLDGWLISLHHAEPAADPACPPDYAMGDDPTAVGLYFAPVDAVEIINLGYPDCEGHTVYQYKVYLDRCCLLCSKPDPRNGVEPAQPGAFLEVAEFGYWLGIQAVTGITWEPPDCEWVDGTLTAHVPSYSTFEWHFWGWHTSPEVQLEEACRGATGYWYMYLYLYPDECMQYGDWDKQDWLCPDPPAPVNMAFELLTGIPRPGDCDGDDDVDLADHAVFVGCMTGPNVPYAPGCDCADLDGDGDVDLADFALFQELFTG